MANIVITQAFGKGINADASPYVLDLNQCESVTNMLFERGLLISRPGTQRVASTLPTGSRIMCAQYPPTSNETPNLGVMVYLKAPISGIELGIRTLGGYLSTIAPPSDFLVESADLVLPKQLYWGISPINAFRFGQYWGVSGCHSGGLGALEQLVLIQADGTVTVSDLPFAPSPMYYVTPHLSRLLMVYLQADLAAPASPIFYWSKLGDATVWDPLVDPSAGSTTLQDAVDGMTGLVVVRNIVVIARPFGFHLGTTTGNSTSPYDLKCFMKDGYGCTFPESLAVYNNKLFYVSDSNVHTFDLNTVEDIGEGVTEELFAILKGAAKRTVRGFVTTTYKSGTRPQYHLLPTNFSLVASTPQVHFVYDILEGKWSRHVYDAMAADVVAPDALRAYALQSLTYPHQSMVTIVRRDSAVLGGATKQGYYYWKKSTVCESTQQFKTGRIQLSDPTTESEVVRMLVVAYCSTNATVCTATFNSFLGNTAGTSVNSFTLNAGWNRVWVNKITVGQFLQITVDIPAGVTVMFRQLCLVADTGQQEVRV